MNMPEFDEKSAISYMRKAVSEESSSLYDDDELLNIIDIIWDWYEDNGFLDIDSDDDPSQDELIKHVIKTISKDSLSPVRKDDIPALVAAELAYEQSLEL